jgi:hypothetical protein
VFRILYSNISIYVPFIYGRDIDFVLVYNGWFMGGSIKSNGFFRSRIPPNKFIDFRSFFLKCFFIRGLGLIILDSVYMACEGVGIIVDL